VTRVLRRPAAPRPADVSTRLRVERLLGAASLEPEGFPPSAILVVRSLADPLPGMIGEGRLEVRAPPEWERAVRGALAERLRAAARPVNGVVAPGAPAVLFADQAELLAAFARDAATGAAAGRWWWAALLRGLGGATLAGLVALWAREARHVPAAVEHLAAWGEAARVMSAIPPAECARLLAAVAHAFELPALLRAPAYNPYNLANDRPAGRALDADGADRNLSFSSADTGSADGGDRGIPRRAAAPPWELMVARGVVPASLAPEQRALMGVSLALHRSPLIARSGAFVERFVRWRAAAASAPAMEQETADRDLSFLSNRTDRTPEQIEHRPDPDRPVAKPNSNDGDREVDARPQVEAHRDEDSTPDRRVEARADESDERRDGAAPIESDAGDGSRREGGAIDLAAGVQSVRKDEKDSSTEPLISEQGPPVEAEPLMSWQGPPVEAAETQSGACGVFFLINAVRSVGFFRALDEHFRLPAVIGGWGWMELLGRALLGPQAAGLAHDPLWKLLGELDGRAPEIPAGFGFEPPAVWTLPPDWARMMESAVSNEAESTESATKAGSIDIGSIAADRSDNSESAATDKLDSGESGAPDRSDTTESCLADESDSIGFDATDKIDSVASGLADKTDSIKPRSQSTEGASNLIESNSIESTSIPSDGGSVRLLGVDPNPDLQRFLGLVVPFLRLRIQATLRAYGADADEGLETALLRRYGMIETTRSHVDVRMELDGVSLPVRLAGLDANPGWVSELARVVTFYFA
jgi:hypothetical protein